MAVGGRGLGKMSFMSATQNGKLSKQLTDGLEKNTSQIKSGVDCVLC
jgi:hypothetical protein